jgi:hypothetical protein
LCVLLVAACTFVGAAIAAGNITYHNQGVFHPMDQYTGSYDDSADRWYFNSMIKSCSSGDCWGRVAFINSGGTWTYGWTDTTSDTVTGISSPDEEFTKKPVCKSNATFLVYNAKCIGSKT